MPRLRFLGFDLTSDVGALQDDAWAAGWVGTPHSQTSSVPESGRKTIAQVKAGQRRPAAEPLVCYISRKPLELAVLFFDSFRVPHLQTNIRRSTPYHTLSILSPTPPVIHFPGMVL